MIVDSRSERHGLWSQHLTVTIGLVNRGYYFGIGSPFLWNCHHVSHSIHRMHDASCKVFFCDFFVTVIFWSVC